MNVEKLEDRMLLMKPQELQQFAAMHKNDPYILPLAMRISDMRKKMQIAQGMQYAGQKPPTVADQIIEGMAAPAEQDMPAQQEQDMPMPEDQGISTLPAQNIEGMADGGIAGYSDNYAPNDANFGFSGSGGTVGYADGGVARYQQGGVPKEKDIFDASQRRGMALFDRALDAEGVKDPKQRAFLKSIHWNESRWRDKSATSNKNAVGPMQIKPSTFKGVAPKGLDINSSLDNMRGGIRYGLEGYKRSNGDVGLASTYYYGGPSAYDAAVQGRVFSDSKNPQAPNTAQYATIVAENTKRIMAGQNPVEKPTAAAAPANSIPKESTAAELAAAQAVYDKHNTYGFANLAKILDPKYRRSVGEGLLNAATGVAAIPVAGVAGLYEQITGNYDSTQERQAAGQVAAARAGEALTYAPRTEEGQNVAGGIAGFLTDTMKLPPYIAGPGGGGGGKQAKVNALPGDGTAAVKATPTVKAAPVAKGTLTELNPAGVAVDAGLPTLTRDVAAAQPLPNVLNPANVAFDAGLPAITPRAKAAEVPQAAAPVKTVAELEAARRSNLAFEQAAEMQKDAAARDALAAEKQKQPASKTKKAKADADAKAAELAAQLDDAKKAVEARRLKESAEAARRNAESDARKAGVVPEAAVPDRAIVPDSSVIPDGTFVPDNARTVGSPVAPYIVNAANAAGRAGNAVGNAAEEDVMPPVSEAYDYSGLSLAGSDTKYAPRRETFDAKVEAPKEEVTDKLIDAGKDAADAAEKQAPEAQKKGFAGLTNEDYLTLGLNMLAGTGPRRGSPLQDLMSSVGTAGIATLGARREREKLATEAEKEKRTSEYQTALANLYKGQTAAIDKTPEMRNALFFQKNPALAEQKRGEEMFKSALSTMDDLMKIRGTTFDPDQIAALDAEIAKNRRIINLYAPKSVRDIYADSGATMPAGVTVTRNP